jgi:hypothetical protein
MALEQFDLRPRHVGKELGDRSIRPAMVGGRRHPDPERFTVHTDDLGA